MPACTVSEGANGTNVKIACPDFIVNPDNQRLHFYQNITIVILLTTKVIAISRSITGWTNFQIDFAESAKLAVSVKQSWRVPAACLRAQYPATKPAHEKARAALSHWP